MRYVEGTPTTTALSNILNLGKMWRLAGSKRKMKMLNNPEAKDMALTEQQLEALFWQPPRVHKHYEEYFTLAA